MDTIKTFIAFFLFSFLALGIIKVLMDIANKIGEALGFGELFMRLFHKKKE